MYDENLSVPEFEPETLPLKGENVIHYQRLSDVQTSSIN